MEIIELARGLGEGVFKASGVLRSGGVIVYPTDTLYGLGADALSDEAVASIYSIKGRDEKKPMHAVFADIAMIEEYAEVNYAARKLAEKFLPGPLTLILKKKPSVDAGISRGIDTIGVRIPDNQFCIDLAKTFGKPYTATSANLAGEPTFPSVKEILEQLGKAAKGIELIIDAGPLPLSQPTTVVNVVSGSPSILREGVIASREILSIH